MREGNKKLGNVKHHIQGHSGPHISSENSLAPCATDEIKRHIVARLKEKLEPLSYIYALWLEGADANGTADEYSDMDIWADIADEKVAEAIDAAESALSEVAEADLKYEKLRGRW